MIENETVTLAYRLRVQHWTGKLVLQVKVRVADGPPDWNGLPTYLAGEYWRDAQVEDLQELKIGESITRTR